MEPYRSERAHGDNGYVQLALIGMDALLAWAELAHGVDLVRTAEILLASDPDDEELALIALDRNEYGSLTVGHIAALLRRIIAQQPGPELTPPRRCIACRRELSDDRSRRRGYGPTCWSKHRRTMSGRRVFA